ncbi:MAG: penicillin-binding protein 2 [Candidatus Pacebacteria bacterium]|nr:penicillin-binding protein 2 [Candidatus Paceibacterota bacterium]
MVISRLFILQMRQGNFYRALAQGQQTSISDEEGKRGGVYFSGGEQLALTEEEPYLFISPEEIEDKEKVAETISAVLGTDKNEVMEKAAKKGSFYEIIKKPIGKDAADTLAAAKLKGIYIGYEPKRFYPQGVNACQIIGFVNKQGEAQYGIESYYDKKLSGKSIIKKDNQNPWSFLLSAVDDGSTNGSSVYLTVDYNVQYMAEKILAEGLEEYGAESGQIVVMEPETGAIIAMAQYPLFDPNNYEKEKDFGVFQNSAVEKLFEPGSIFKAITMAGALNEKKVTPDTTYNDDKGYEQYGTYKVANYNSRIWGKITMTNALEHSINTGLMFAERQLGNQKFMDYLENFGFFEKTGVDLAGEVYSENNELKKAFENKNSQVSFANASFGQGIGLTPLQITTAYCAIANGGNLVKPYIVKEIDKNGQKETTSPEIVRRVITTETSDTLKKMLVSVIENGYGHLAKVPGYYIAGKTGTAQVPWSSLGINKNGYSEHTWQTFMGFAPAYNPKFVALIKLDNPVKVKTSEYSATPMFYELAKYLLDYWQIPPDYTDEPAK